MKLSELGVGDKFRFKQSEGLDSTVRTVRTRIGSDVDTDMGLWRGYREVEIVEDTSDTVTNAKGGKQSRLDARMDLLPAKALMHIAKILAAGAKKYGEWNWKKIDNPDHINHSVTHFYKYLLDDNTEDHLGNAACRALFALEMELEKKK